MAWVRPPRGCIGELCTSCCTSRRGPTLAERSAVGTAAELDADSELAALRDRPRPVLTRHCWVSGLPECPGRWAGLLAGRMAPRTPRPAAGRAAWCTPSTTVRRRSSSRRGCTPPPATSHLAGPSRSGVCGDLPRGGGGGEVVDAGSALGDALGVFLCPLSVALALLAQPRPQVLGLSVGPLARLVGGGCPLRPWRALLVQVSRRAPRPGSAPGPGAELRRCRPSRRERSWCRRCSVRGSCGRPW
jgi:hypothetical protein